MNGLSPAALWDSWLQTPNKLLYVVRFEVVELMEEPTPWTTPRSAFIRAGLRSSR